MLKRAGANALLLLGGLAAGILLLEAALRICGISYPIFYDSTDEKLGWGLRPGAEGWWTSEGRAFVRINADGLRDRDHAREKPPGVYRIAVLGDSYAEALQLPMEDAFWSVLERDLSGCGALGGRKTEAINFGVSGYGTAQELLTLRHRVWKYSPDLVLLAFTPGNDIRNNFRALEKDPGRPYFVYRGNDLLPDNAYLASWRFSPSWKRSAFRMLARLSDFSRIVQVANRAKNAWLAGREAARQSAAAAAPSGGGEGTPAVVETGIDDSVYRDAAGPLWGEAWRVTEAILERMAEETREKGAGFLVVAVSSGLQAHPDPKVRRAAEARLGAGDLFYAERRLESFCRSKGIAVLNLGPEFQARAERDGIFLHGFGKNAGWGHWNAAGHRLAGNSIAQAVCKELEKEEIFIPSGSAPSTSRK